MKILAAMTLALILSASASGRTWTVMQDGSGDHTTIQAAVDGSAVGDTVLVGPGRYDQFHEFETTPEVVFDVIVGLTVDSLTIRGVDQESVIIGPTEWGNERAQKIGISSSLQSTWVTIENMTFENLSSRGVQLYPSGYIGACKFISCYDGVLCEVSSEVIIDNSEFFSSHARILSSPSATDRVAIITNSTFNNGSRAYISGHANSRIDHCSFANVNNSIYIGGRATCVISQCTITGGWYGIATATPGPNHITLLDSHISGQEYNCITLSSGILTGSGNTLRCDGDYTIAGSNCAASFHGNHILKSRLGAFTFNFYNIPDEGIDLTNNWWGTTNPDSISAWIHDGNDDPTLPIVQFEPFALEPVGEEKSSVSDLKSMYR